MSRRARFPGFVIQVKSIIAFLDAPPGARSGTASRRLPFMAWYLKASHRRRCRRRLNCALASSDRAVSRLTVVRLRSFRDTCTPSTRRVIGDHRRYGDVLSALSRVSQCPISLICRGKERKSRPGKMYGYSYQELSQRMMSSMEGK